MASSSSSTSLAAALGAPPTQLLTRENALVWKTLVVHALRGACVLELVEGSEEAPVKLLETEDINKKKVTVPNPKYTTWITRDQQVLRWLLSALSLDVLGHIIGMESSTEVGSAASVDSGQNVEHAPASSPPGVRTRLQKGIRNPKKYTDCTIRYGMLSSTGEPCSTSDTLKDPNWRQAMQDEFNALIENNTWHLVSPSREKI
jgi:hypothetical protein